MAEINDLNITDASNTARFPEGQAPSSVNDGARALEGILARWHKDTNASIAAGGTGDAITVAANQTLTAYYDGLVMAFEATAANTTAVTLNVDSVGAKAIRKNFNLPLSADDIKSGQKVVVIFDSSADYWQMISPLGNQSVSGPASSTANSLARWDGTTGGLLKDGAAIGTDVQAYHARLADIAGITFAQGDIIYHNGSNIVKLAAGTSGHFLKTQGAGANPTWAENTVTNDVLLYQDQKSSGTVGDAYTAGAWRTHTVNTEVVDTGSIGSISSNQITLAAGSYIFWANANTGHGNGASKGARLRLRNVTDGTTVAQGVNFYAATPNTDDALLVSCVGQFTIATSKVFELQVYPVTADGAQARALSTGDVEVYLSALFRRYAT